MHSQFEPTCVCIRVRKLWSCSIFQPTSTLDFVIDKEQGIYTKGVGDLQS